MENIRYGEQIPSEQQLSAQYGVSRGTVRQAITEMVSEGLLYKIQGKGTFKGGIAVSHSRYAGLVHSFTEQLMRGRLQPGIRDVDLATVPAPERVAHLLHMEIGAPVWRLSRTRLANNLPIAEATAYILKELTPNLRAQDLEMSLMEMLDKCHDICFIHSETFCQASLAAPDLAARLGRSQGAPILHTEYVGYFPAHYPAMVDITYSLGDKYILRIDQGDTTVTQAE